MIDRCSLGSARGRWILLATLLASSTAFLMGTAVAVALPSIQDYFDAGVAGIQWVVNAQLLALAALLLVGGSLGDHFGRKRILVIGILIFAAGALLSAVAARSIGLLIAFQAVQGVGAALMIPQSLAIINACFVEGERGQAIGLWAGLSGGIAALGPWLGGWVVETFLWQAVFLMALPFLAASLFVTLRFVPENRDPAARRLDWYGTGLVFLALLGTAYGLISGPSAGWSAPPVLIGLIGGAAALVLFVVVQLRSADPLVPPRMLRSRLVAGANTVTLFLYFALNGIIFFLVLRLQQVQGYSPTEAGLALLPPILLITFLAAPAGALADRIGPRFQMILGPVAVALGMAWLAIGGTESSYLKQFLPGLALFGIGMALAIAPITKSALSVEPGLSGAASGFNNSVSRIAALMAVAVLGAIVLATFSGRLTDELSATSLTPEQQQEIQGQADKLGGIVIPDEFDDDERASAEQAVKRSFVYGFRWAMTVGAVLALAGAVVSFVTIRAPARPPPRMVRPPH
jgi:EmrB/QacA subfamily drug resistance transporter